MTCQQFYRLVGAIVCALALSTGAAVAQFTDPPAGPPTRVLPQFQNLGIDQHLGATVPLDLMFRDETGKSVTLGSYFDHKHPVLLTLVQFRCPNLCTLILNDTLRCMRAMPLSAGKDYTVLTISFDPKETAELAAAKKRQYIDSYRRNGSEAGWHFLTADSDSIDALTKAIGFKYQFDRQTNQYIHPSGITILTAGGQVSRYFFGLAYQPNDVRLALLDASSQRIGSVADQVLLFCYHYDPSTGRYSLAVFRALRVLAGVMLAAIAIFLFVMFRREMRSGFPKPRY